LESTVKDPGLSRYPQVLLQILVGWHEHGGGAIGAKYNRHAVGFLVVQRQQNSLSACQCHVCTSSDNMLDSGENVKLNMGRFLSRIGKEPFYQFQ
jgi:hypothetical protein